MNSGATQRIAVLIPCLNEALTVAKVVQDFKKNLPAAEIFVFDNDSDDDTARIAVESGAAVHEVKARGKGNVVAAMFRAIDADFYIMVDGDATYPAEQASRLLDPVQRGDCDMAVGKRIAANQAAAFPRFHQLGNKIISGIVNFFFKSKISDVFSGYRAFNRKIVRAIPLLSRGFEVETELTLQALDKGFNVTEVEIPYLSRPEGSRSKLKTYTDGMLVLKTIFSIVKDYRPLPVFGICSLLAFLFSLGAGSFVISEFLETGKVMHPSTAVLAAALMILALLSLATGLILDTIKRHFSELYQLTFNLMDTSKSHG